MPPAVAGAAWFVPALMASSTVAASAIGASKQAGAANRATEAQERARQEALAYERERMAGEQKEREYAWDQYRKAYKDWYDMYGDEGVRMYGSPTGVDLSGLRGGGQAPATATSAPAAPAAADLGVPPRMTLGDLAGGVKAEGTPVGVSLVPEKTKQPELMQTAERRPGTIADLAGWEDWRRYGVGA